MKHWVIARVSADGQEPKKVTIGPFSDKCKAETALAQVGRRPDLISATTIRLQNGDRP